jgi:hypothetical protein
LQADANCPTAALAAIFRSENMTAIQNTGAGSGAAHVSSAGPREPGDIHDAPYKVSVAVAEISGKACKDRGTFGGPIGEHGGVQGRPVGFEPVGGGPLINSPKHQSSVERVLEVVAGLLEKVLAKLDQGEGNKELSGKELENAGIAFGQGNIWLRSLGDGNDSLSKDELLKLQQNGVIKINAEGEISLTEKGQSLFEGHLAGVHNDNANRAINRFDGTGDRTADQMAQMLALQATAVAKAEEQGAQLKQERIETAAAMQASDAAAVAVAKDPDLAGLALANDRAMTQMLEAQQQMIKAEVKDLKGQSL